MASYSQASSSANPFLVHRQCCLYSACCCSIGEEDSLVFQKDNERSKTQESLTCPAIDLQDALNFLREGAQLKYSLPCALFYARFLTAIDAKSIFSVQAKQEIVGFMVFAAQHSIHLWGDPQEDVVKYTDRADRLFGEEVCFPPCPISAHELTSQYRNTCMTMHGCLQSSQDLTAL